MQLSQFFTATKTFLSDYKKFENHRSNE